MPDPKIELWSPTRFLPYGRNPRKNDHVVDQMVASILEFGFKVPMLARSTGEVVDGHLRLKAAIAIGLEAIPTILCDEWSDAQVRAFRIMVNKSVEWADWDADLLTIELGELKELNFDLTLTGFDLSEVDGLLSKSWEPPARESQKPATSQSSETDVAPDVTSSTTLAERFGVPPFSILDARQGYWQDRKRAWLALGIQSELGREG